MSRKICRFMDDWWPFILGFAVFFLLLILGPSKCEVTIISKPSAEAKP